MTQITGSISTAVWTGSANLAVPRLQKQISDAGVELSTGRRADVGLSLGAGAGESVLLHAARASIDSQTKSLALSSAIIGRAQTVLSQISSDANAFLQNMVAARASNDGGAVAAQQAQSTLAALTAGLNTSDGQRYIFAGINSAVAPVADFGAAPKAAVDAAFAAKFGLDPASPQTDPKVASIGAADMESFLNTDFAGMFSDTAWSTTWSKASDQPLAAKLSNNAHVDTSTTANTTAMRNLAMAYTMVAGLGTANLSEAARNVVLDKATKLVGTAVTQLAAVGAGLGVSQNRIDRASEALTQAGTLIDTRIGALEGVDAAEAKTRMDVLTTQLQMSYATTGKLMQLSILNYI